LTNPPFGGEEADSIRRKFPADLQTKDTALGFLQHVIARLNEGGKCGIILPRGTTLSGTGVYAKVREKLLTECNLHTIIKLDKSVFQPYAGIPTRILFFEKTGPTKEIWYYEMQLPNRRGKKIKAYSKLKPIIFEDFSEVIDWYAKKEKNENAWKIKVEDVIKNNFILEIDNPNNKEIKPIPPPHELIKQILDDQKKIHSFLEDIEKIIKNEVPK